MCPLTLAVLPLFFLALLTTRLVIAAHGFLFVNPNFNNACIIHGTEAVTKGLRRMFRRLPPPKWRQCDGGYVWVSDWSRSLLLSLPSQPGSHRPRLSAGPCLLQEPQQSKYSLWVEELGDRS
jgi:hypothetical protein